MAFGKKQNHASGAVPELGAIFMSNRATKKLCISWKIFGLPYSKAGFVKHVKAGMFLFLFEHETRMLYGVYQACSDGAMNLSSEAFRSSGNKYPAQVEVRVLWHCKPLTEDEFRPAIEDNYFAAYKFNFGLSGNQVRELLLLFSSRRMRDELPQLEIPPSNPSLIQGASWSSFTGDGGEKYAHRAKNEFEPENASAFELHKNRDNFSVPNSAVDGRLVMDSNKVTAYEEAGGTTSPRFSNYIGGSSDQYSVTQVGDIFKHGCDPENDYVLKFSSGSPRAPFLTGSKRLRINAGYVHNDSLSVQNIPANRQLQNMRHGDSPSWDDRAYAAANTVNAESLIDGDGIQTFAGQNRVTRDMHHRVSDSNINSVPYCPSSLPEIGNEMPVDELRKPSLICYSGPKIPSSMPSYPVYCDNAACEGPILYDPDYGTCLRAGGKYQEVHYSLNSSGNPHGNIHDVRESLSKENPSPPESNAFIMRQSVGRPGTSGNIRPLIPSGYPPASQRIEYLGSENYEDAQLNSSAFSLAHGRENSGPSVCMNNCGPVDINQDSKFYQGRELTSQNRRSVFSRLKPALDAEETNRVVSSGKDAQNNIDSTVTEVMEVLSGHYSQLLRQFSSETKQMVDVDDDDNYASEIAKYEPPVSKETDFLVAGEHAEAEVETHNTKEMPRLTFKRRSEARKTRGAVKGGLSEKSCTILSEKPSKRRKLVRPRLTDKMQNGDAMVDKISPDSVSSQPCRDGSCKTHLPSSQDQERNPPQVGSSGASAASDTVGCSIGRSSSNKLADGRSEIVVTSEPEKHEGQAMLNPCANDIPEKLPKPCNSVSPMLAATAAPSTQEGERGETCTALSQNPKTDGKAIFDDANSELHPRGDGGHDASIHGNVGDGSSNDPLILNLDKDGRTESCLMMVGGNQEMGGTVTSSDTSVAPTREDKEGAPAVKKELGESPNDAAVVANGNRQHKLPDDLNLSTSLNAEEDTKGTVEGEYVHKQLTLDSSIQGH